MKGDDYMEEQEKKILDTFAKILPTLTEQQREKLLWFGEGLAFKVETDKKLA